MAIPTGTERVALTLTTDGAKLLRTMGGWYGVRQSRIVEAALELFHCADNHSEGKLDIEDLVRQWRSKARMTAGRGIVSSIVPGDRPRVGPDAEVIGGEPGELTKDIEQ